MRRPDDTDPSLACTQLTPSLSAVVQQVSRSHLRMLHWDVTRGRVGGLRIRQRNDQLVMVDPLDNAQLLARWKASTLSRADLYGGLQDAMRRRARQGLWSIIGDRPNEDDINEVVYEAFVELEDKGPEFVTSSLVGTARRLAYWRGQDLGRRRNRERERQIDEEIDWDRLDPRTSAATDDPVDEDEWEAQYRWAMACMETLTDGQRDVVEATIMGDQTLSDWVLDRGVTHQAASRMRDRAVQALKRCTANKQNQAEGSTI